MPTADTPSPRPLSEEERDTATAAGVDQEGTPLRSVNQQQEPEPSLDASLREVLAAEQSEATLREVLAHTRMQKHAAVTEQDFDAARTHRAIERALLAELAERFPAGVFSIRIGYPDGTHREAESPSLGEALELVGFVEITDELRALLYAARVLDRAYSGAGAAYRA